MTADHDLSPDDRAALASFVTRWQRTFYSNRDAKKAKEEAEATIAENGVTFSQLRSALALYDVVIEGDAGWDKVRELIGGEAFDTALIRAGWVPPQPPPPPPPLPALQLVSPEDDNGNELFDVVEAEPLGTDTENVSTIRDIVLEYLKAAKDAGIKAAEAREYVEALRHSKIHEKTVGMTLYRLSNDGLARREGRTWFFVPPKADTKNPGGETPGSK